MLAELQRIADHLIVLNQGRVQLAGSLDEITAAHRLVIGPIAPPRAAGLGLVITAQQFSHHAQLLVRTASESTVMHPAWQAQPASLEEIVLAYLQNPEAACTGPVTAAVA
jgi:ABC-2 type transport system ATP-binding protein